MSSMRAGQFNTNTNQVEINTVPIPQPGVGQILVQITSASLCHSDLNHSLRPRTDTPVTIGHEGVGIINTIHPSVPADKFPFQIGDQVGFLYFIGGCYTCDGCIAHPLHCIHNTQQLQGFTTDGFFAPYAVADWQNVAKLPSSLDRDRMAPLFCAGITAFHAVDSCELVPGNWIAIVGCGGLGQFAIRIAKAMQLNVIGLDVADDTLEIAKSAGADVTFNVKTESETYVDAINKLTNDTPDTSSIVRPIVGPHAVVVLTGSDAAYATATSLVRIAGVVMVVGIAKSDKIPISTLDLTTNRFRLKAESTSTVHRMGKAVDFVTKHAIMADIDYFQLDELPEMVRRMESGTAPKRMAVKFSQADRHPE